MAAPAEGDTTVTAPAEGNAESEGDVASADAQAAPAEGDATVTAPAESEKPAAAEDQTDSSGGQAAAAATGEDGEARPDAPTSGSTQSQVSNEERLVWLGIALGFLLVGLIVTGKFRTNR